MAAANTLREEIICNVCLDVYQDPHILKECLHTYCLKCIKSLENEGEIRCPDCRTFTDIENIKQDFKTQRLIDIYHAQQSEPVHVVLDQHQCGICETTTKQCTHHCADCEIFLCSSCAQSHENGKAFRSHKVTPTATMMEDIEYKLTITLSDAEKQVQNIDSKLEAISQNLTGVEKAKKHQINYVNEYLTSMIEEMKENQERIEQVVSDANQNLINHLRRSKTMFEQQKRELQLKILLLKGLSESEDGRTLQESALTVNETTKRDIRKIKEIIQKKNVDLESPVNIAIIEDSGSEHLQVNIRKLQYESQEIMADYSELPARKLTPTHSTHLDYKFYSLSMINNQLWCIDHEKDILHVYDTKCRQMKEVRHDLLPHPECIEESIIDNVVTCRGNKGLHMIESDGEYRSKIADGSYSSGACYNGDIYSLEFERCQVVVLRNNRKKWVEVNCYSLKHTNGSDYDKLCVEGSNIYVSSWHNHCIYVYDIQGKFLYTKGEKGSDAGQLYHPILCSVDNDGNILVADCFNHRLQVCDSSGQWTVVKLPGEVKYPGGVALSDEGDLFVIIGDLNNIKLVCYRNTPHLIESKSV